MHPEKCWLCYQSLGSSDMTDMQWLIACISAVNSVQEPVSALHFSLSVCCHSVCLAWFGHLYFEWWCSISTNLSVTGIERLDFNLGYDLSSLIHCEHSCMIEKKKVCWDSGLSTNQTKKARKADSYRTTEEKAQWSCKRMLIPSFSKHRPCSGSNSQGCPSMGKCRIISAFDQTQNNSKHSTLKNVKRFTGG